MRFSETLAGRLGDPSLPRAEAGRTGGDTRFLLTVVTTDVARMAADPDHRSPAWGCLLAPWLHPEPLSVVDGRLDLFVDVAAPGERRRVEMRYRLDLRTLEGARFVLLGTKELRRRLWWWTFPWDATTLAVDLREGGDDGPLRAHGVLRQGLVGVLAQGATFRATSFAGWAAFFRYYLGVVGSVYL